MALRVTVRPSFVTPQAIKGARPAWRVWRRCPQKTHHVDYSGQLVEDGLAREVQHADQACRGEWGERGWGAHSQHPVLGISKRSGFGC